MNKKTVLVSVLGFLTVVAVVGCSTAAQNTSTTSTTGDATQGLADLKTYCQECHGYPSSANISPMTEEEARAFLSTHEGLNLDAQTIDDMVAYLMPYDSN